MKNKKKNNLCSIAGILLFVACSLHAQDKPGAIAALEFQKPKNGMAPQYEAGRKQKAAWHKQQNDPQPLLVWEIMSGDNTGTYVVGRLQQHWADFDKPPISDEADLAEFQKVVGSFVDSLTARYYEYLPKVSNPTGDKSPSKFAEILTFYVKYGKSSDFRSAMARVTEAAAKTKWPPKYEWYELSSGGPADTFVLALPHNSWADFEDKPEVKPFREMLKDAFGQSEADSIMERFDNSVQKETSEIIQFRPDLSYLPGK
jgi:hypothetical protein